MEERTPRWILALLGGVPLLLLLLSFFVTPLPLPKEQGEPSVFKKGNDYLKQNMPFSGYLREMGLEFRFLIGETKQKGIYISNRGLLRDIPLPNEEITKQNNAKVLEMAEIVREKDEDITVALMIVPSAPSVLQQQLPRFSTPVNQRNYTENIYNQMTGRVSTIATYPVLLEQRQKYLYYRTEDTFTGEGGYYLYRELLKRMLSGEEPLSLSSFEVSYGAEYLGGLYYQVPYGNVRPDQPMYFTYVDSLRTHKVTHTFEGRQVAYKSLYPKERRGLGAESYLGGSGGITVVESSSTYDISLLILGDTTALSYIPFLSNHYGTITFIDIAKSPEELANYALGEYDQILVGVSLETYTTQPLFEELNYENERNL